MPIVWVAVGGRSDLTATLVGTFVLLCGFQTLTVYCQQYALVVIGRAARRSRFMLARRGSRASALRGMLPGSGRQSATRRAPGEARDGRFC